MSSEIFNDTVKNDKCIGSGGFGHIYEVNGTNLLRKETNINFNENLREVCFLSTYKDVPFIAKFIKCEIDETKNMIQLYMENAGNSLRELSKTLNTEDRIRLVPTILIQFARILIWMKQEKIIHGDVKPANICMDKNLMIRLIDWGFVQKVYKGNKYTIGTDIFSEPEAYNGIRIDYESELFAFGLSICYFLMSGMDYDNWEEFCCEYEKDDVEYESLNKRAIDILQLEKLREKFRYVFGDYYYYDIIVSMLNLDKESRIDDEELYDLCPDELKLKYPLIECYSHCEEIITTRLPEFQNITDKNLGILYEWLLNLKFKLKIKASLFNATQIFFKYLHLKNTDKKHIQYIAIMCLYISNIMNNEYIVDISKCAKICCEKDNSNMNMYLIDILKTLDFKVFPECENTEYNKKDEDVWKSLFLSSNIFCLPVIDIQSFDHFYNIFKSEKKYTV
jgi:serine/threonine protein kinase